MPCLVIENGSLRGQRFEIPPGGKLVVGRDAQAQVPLEDQLCSRRHLEVVCCPDGKLVVRDLDSSNGTYVNEKRIGEHDLLPGDNIQAGTTRMSIVFDSNEADAARGLVGKVVGGYMIIERLGRGAMGTVYKANQISLDRVVALKILSPRLSTNPREVTRFINEARAAAKLNHQNIVHVHETSSDRDLHFYSMEYIENGSVQDLANKEGKLDPDLALSIILDAARGLEYAEKRGIVHRDIKPDNLMVNADGVVKISDMGLARDAGEMSRAAEQGTAGEDGIFGTPHFISPEQARGEKVDTRSDIYSLGATLYRLLAGVTPFQGANIREIIQKQIAELPQPIRETVPSVPAVLDEITLRMLKKDPAERPQTAAQLVLDLEEVQKRAENGQGKRTTLVIAGVILLGGAAFGIWSATQPTNGDHVPTPTPVIIQADDSAARAREAEAAAKVRAAEARERFAELRIEDSQLSGAKRTAEKLADLKARYQAFATTFADTPAVADVDTVLAALQVEVDAHHSDETAQANAAATREKNAQARKAAALRTADEAITTGNHGVALTALESAAAAPEVVGSAHASELQARAAAILVALHTDCNALLEQARTNADVNAAATALSTRAGQLREGLGATDTLKPVADLAASLESASAAMRTAHTQKLAADAVHDSKLQQTALRAATIELHAKFDLAAPRAQIEAAVAQLRTSAAAAPLRAALADIEALERFKQAITAELSSGLKNPPLRMPSERDPARLVTWNWVGADAAGFSAKIGNGEPRKFLWSELRPAMLFEHVFKGRLPEAAAVRRDAAVFALRCGLPEDAMALLAADTDSSPTVAALRQRVATECEAAALMLSIRELEKQAGTDTRAWLQLLPRIDEFLKSFANTVVGTLNTRGDAR